MLPFQSSTQDPNNYLQSPSLNVSEPMAPLNVSPYAFLLIDKKTNKNDLDICQDTCLGFIN